MRILFALRRCFRINGAFRHHADVFDRECGENLGTWSLSLGRSKQAADLPGAWPRAREKLPQASPRGEQRSQEVGSASNSGR
ncbi:uncharacterized [Tachysurus ichikawai]